MVQQSELPRPKPHQNIGLLDPPYIHRSHRRLLASGYLIALLLCVVWTVGCGDYEPAKPPPAQEPIAKPSPTPEQEPVQPVLEKEPQSVKAAKGVGKKGRGYGQGVVATPIGSYFAMRERIAFDVQLPNAMKMFKALEGRAPKDHEEFMEKIIKANHIQLPELPEGHRYQYDPKTEQLMVEQPVDG